VIWRSLATISRALDDRAVSVRYAPLPDQGKVGARRSAAMRRVRVIEFLPYSIKERAACDATKPRWKSDYGGNFGGDNSLDSNFGANI
jgi:hypothetical protein